jgi:hypothetical protein
MGRPIKKDKKKQLGVKLPPYIIEWLNSKEKSNAKLIEEALIKTFEIKKS